MSPLVSPGVSNAVVGQSAADHNPRSGVRVTPPASEGPANRRFSQREDTRNGFRVSKAFHAPTSALRRERDLAACIPVPPDVPLLDIVILLLGAWRASGDHAHVDNGPPPAAAHRTPPPATGLPFGEAVVRARQELARERFEIQCEIDVQATLARNSGSSVSRMCSSVPMARPSPIGRSRPSPSSACSCRHVRRDRP